MRTIFFAAAIMLLTFTACAGNVDTTIADATNYEQEPILITQPVTEETGYTRVHFATLGFSIEFPSYWNGKFGLHEFDVELDFGTRRHVDVYHITTRQEVLEEFEHPYGGRILTLGVSPREDYTYDYPPIMAGGTIILAQSDGNTYFVNFPSGVEYIEGNESAAEFLRMIGNWEPSHWDFLARSFQLGR